MIARLVVEAPAGSYDAERRYALDVVLGGFLGVAFDYVEAPHLATWRLRLAGQPDGPALVLPDVLFQTAPRHWLTRHAMPQRPLARMAVPRDWGGGVLPVLYGRPEAPLVQEDGDMVLGLDIFGSAFYMLTRYEEVVRPERDHHGRFPVEAALAHQEGFLEVPIVDAYVEVLRQALGRLWPGLAAPPPPYRFMPTHDVDHPFSPNTTALQTLRASVADVVRRQDAGLAVRRMAAWSNPGFDAKDPHDTFDFLMDCSERHGAMSAFYFMPEPGIPDLDGNYELDDPRLRRLLRAIHDRGHEVGFHPSYGTLGDPTRLRRELAKLHRVCAEVGVVQDRWGGRHHFLRAEVPRTWRDWDAAGLTYDGSIAFATAPGFRCGTCRAFQTFDLVGRRPLRLVERPLIAMETTLLIHQRAGDDAALATVVRLASACYRVGGDFTLLWHNCNLITRSQRRLYEAVLAAVASPTWAGQVAC